MPDLVKVSTVETTRSLMAAIEEYVKSERYAEITQAIGMHSILIESEHMLGDQRTLYRLVLDLIKSRLSTTLGKKYASWYADFPRLMDELVAGNRIVVDAMSAGVLSSRHAASGPFKSLDDFYFWCLEDRRLSLAQIVKYIERTAEATTH